MKKYITLIFINLALAVSMFGQCIPDPAYTLPGIYPDSATGFPPAVATHEYNLVITAVIPADTIVPPFPRLNIDSIGVALITGLPEGFQALPSRPSGYWLGGTSGCMLITGTPTETQVGFYPLVFTVVGYMGGIPLPFPYDITFYSITVLPASAYGVDEQGIHEDISMKVFPNPFSENVSLYLFAKDPGSFNCLIYDTKGRLVKSESLVVIKGDNTFTIDGSSLDRGIYFCRIRQPDNSFFAKAMLIK